MPFKLAKFVLSLYKDGDIHWEIQGYHVERLHHVGLDLQSNSSIRRTGLTAKELKRLDIDIVALTQTRKENAGSPREDNYT